MGRLLLRPTRLARALPGPGRAAAALALLALASAPKAEGAEDSASRPQADESERVPTQQEIEAFLDSRSLPKSDSARGAPLEVPPPPPRSRGVVLEAGSGAVFPLGALRHVSPPSPWLQIHLGYDVGDWFMVLVNADLTLASTRYAARPPEPRTYAIGTGGRFQLRLTEWLAGHAQLELGVSQATEEVLLQYGYGQADSLNLHYGGRIGLEWLQVNPHLALGAQGTFRNYSGLDRTNSAEAPTALIAAVALRYTF